jgi:hypothetical protein
MYLVGVLEHGDQIDRQMVPEWWRSKADGLEMEIVAIGVVRVSVIDERRIRVAPDQAIVAPSCSVSAEANRAHSLLDLPG